jgi:hypothetical protein
MAARVDPRHVRARRQSVHHFVANAPWEAAAVLRIAREWVLESTARHGPVTAWILDETAFPKNAYSGEAEHPDPPMVKRVWVKRVWISRAGGPRGETEGSPGSGGGRAGIAQEGLASNGVRGRAPGGGALRPHRRSAPMDADRGRAMSCVPRLEVSRVTARWGAKVAKRDSDQAGEGGSIPPRTS